MTRKVVILDADLFDLLLKRCTSDVELAKVAMRQTHSILTGKMAVDYMVKMERFKRALETARDE